MMRRDGTVLGLGGLVVGTLLGVAIGYAWGIRTSGAAGSTGTIRRGAGRLQDALATFGLGEPADQRLAARVRLAIARTVSDPDSLSIGAEAGRVTLAGTVRPREVEPLLRAAAAVRGVREIENLLTVVQDPARRQGLPGTH